MKNYTVILLLSILIGSLNSQFSQEIKRETRRITENFDGPFYKFFDDNGFKVENGEFKFSGGDSTQYYFNSFIDDFYDFTVSVKTIWKSGQKNSAYGIIFRRQENNLYAFDITQTGYYRLQLFRDNNWKTLVDWTKTFKMKGMVNELKITCKESNIKCYINNSKQIDIIDNSILHGDVGFGANGDLICSYDSFSMGPPEGNEVADNNGIVYEDFEGSSSFTYDENWTIKNGELIFKSVNTKYGETYLPNKFSDFTLTTKSRWIGKGENIVFGIVFRVNENEGYSFSINNSNEFLLMKATDDGVVKLIDWTRSDYLLKGSNELKIICNGQRIDCFVNNHKVASVNDESFSKGYVGLFADPKVECAFDDFKVGPPEVIKEELVIKSENVLLSDNFNGVETEFGSNQYWKLADGRLICSNGNPEKLHRNTLEKNYDDCTIRVKAKWDGRADNNGYGISFGESDGEYYVFLISPDKFYQLSRWNGEEWKDFNPWTRTNLLTSGYNNLKVTCVDNMISAYINNNLVMKARVEAYSGGDVGLTCSGKLDASFDDFSISTPDADISQINYSNTQEVYRDNFNSDKTEFGLTKCWWIDDGRMQFRGDDESRMFWNKINSNYTNCVVSVDAKWEDNAKNQGFGLRFGGRYGFIIAQDGHYKLAKIPDEEWINLVGWQTTDLVNSGDNHLKVVCKDKRIQAYLNNVLVVDVIDDNYNGGFVGVLSAGDVEASFDNFTVEVLK